MSHDSFRRNPRRFAPGRGDGRCGGCGADMPGPSVGRGDPPGAGAPGERPADQPRRTEPAFDARAWRPTLPRKRAETVTFPDFGRDFGSFLRVNLAL
jgi:hypothetical protein